MMGTGVCRLSSVLGCRAPSRLSTISLISLAYLMFNHDCCPIWPQCVLQEFVLCARFIAVMILTQTPRQGAYIATLSTVW